MSQGWGHSILVSQEGKCDRKLCSDNLEIQRDCRSSRDTEGWVFMVYWIMVYNFKLWKIIHRNAVSHLITDRMRWVCTACIVGGYQNCTIKPLKHLSLKCGRRHTRDQVSNTRTFLFLEFLAHLPMMLGSTPWKISMLVASWLCMVESSNWQPVMSLLEISWLSSECVCHRLMENHLTHTLTTERR